MTLVTRNTATTATLHDTPPPAARSHEVRHGETLRGIAAEQGVPLAALIGANPEVRNPDVIYPGTRLTLPDAAHYTVKPGDNTLDHIARELGLPLDALQAANPQLLNPDLVQPGDTLNLPPLGLLAESLPLSGVAPVSGVLGLLSPVFMADPAYRQVVAHRAAVNNTMAGMVNMQRDNTLNADPGDLRAQTQRELAEPAPLRTDGTRTAPVPDQRRLADPPPGANQRLGPTN